MDCCVDGRGPLASCLQEAVEAGQARLLLEPSVQGEDRPFPPRSFTLNFLPCLPSMMSIVNSDKSQKRRNLSKRNSARRCCSLVLLMRD
jgi:hypothetical protein